MHSCRTPSSLALPCRARSECAVQVGASPASHFRVYSQRASGGVGIVKTWCLPKNHQNGSPMRVDDCTSTRETIRISNIMKKVDAKPTSPAPCTSGRCSHRITTRSGDTAFRFQFCILSRVWRTVAPRGLWQYILWAPYRISCLAYARIWLA